MATLNQNVLRNYSHSCRAPTVEANGNDGEDVVDLDLLNEKDATLAQLGYKPVFDRGFGYFATFSFAASIGGCFATTIISFVYPLYAGGSASAIWCWLISGIGCMALAASVAELVSAYPTSGGLYFTVSRLAPPEWVPLISWVTGWLNLIGQICAGASVEFGTAGILLAVVSIGSDGAYFPTTRHTVAVQVALCILHGTLNSMNTRWLAKITSGYVVFHGLTILACCIALLVMCPNRHSARYVFTNVTVNSGWPSTGFSFLFGFLSVSWVMTDYDATAHITEEIDEPERKAPWAIFLAMALTYIVGWLFTIVLCFTMGDPTELLANKLEQPVIQLFYNNLGKTGAIVFASSAFIILNTCAVPGYQAMGRTVFSLARDGMLPGSSYLKIVNKTTKTPLLALWWAVFWCIALSLIALGSYEAATATFNVCAIAMDWSYCIPIACKLFWGKLEPGPWYMGRYGKYVNAWALIWTAFASVIFLLPNFYPVTKANMNYAVVILIFILLCAGVSWVVRGRGFYNGPVRETRVVEGVAPIREE